VGNHKVNDSLSENTADSFVGCCVHTYIHTYSFHQSSLWINCIWIWNMSI